MSASKEQINKSFASYSRAVTLEAYSEGGRHVGSMMLVTTIVSVFITVAGWIVSPGSKRMGALFIGASVLIASLLGTGFIAYPVAHSASQASAIGGYNQYLDGTVLDTDVKVTECERDGWCRWTYQCDMYYVPVYHPAVTDAKGNVVVQAYTEQVPTWHDCPYTTREYTYTLTARAWHDFDFTIADHIFEANPQKWRRSGDGIPSNTKVARGVPAMWQHATDSLKNGYADSITVPDQYPNYILSGEADLYNTYSDKIDSLKKAGLLPKHTGDLEKGRRVHNQYLADKVSFVGFDTTPAIAQELQDQTMRLNAQVGTELQGDIHLVFVQCSRFPAGVTQQDYARALKAYWLTGLGKDALGKNGIGIAMCVDDTGTIVKWAEAFTGMPVGNGVMVSRLNTLIRDVPFTADMLIGRTAASVSMGQGHKPTVTYTTASGIIPQVIVNQAPFKRACMECDDDGENSAEGFVGLKDRIPIGTGGKVWGSVITSFIILAISAGVFFLYLGGDFTGSTSSTWNTDPTISTRPSHRRRLAYRRY